MRGDPQYDVNSALPVHCIGVPGLLGQQPTDMASDFVSSSITKLDDETGEVDQTVICLRSTPRTCSDYKIPTQGYHSDRSSFRVPNSFHTPSDKKQNGVYVQRELTINGVDLTVLNTQHLSPIAFVLPTLLLFPAWAAIIAVLCEASIHIWFHKRNKLKNDNQTLFRSPFNLITSEFCAKCRTEKWMQKISKIQDKRSMRRNLIDPSFIKHVVR